MAAARLDETKPGDIVRMVGRFCQRQDRRETRLAGLEQCASFGAWSREEQRGKPLLDARPTGWIVNMVIGAIFGNPDQVAEPCIELWFGRLEHDPFSVGGFVAVIMRRAGVEHVDPRSLHHEPWVKKLQVIALSTAAPSIIAQSITCPGTPPRTARSAATMPNASINPPPPKSPTALAAGVGLSPARP